MFLPGFDIGAFPNHLNRSSLFAPVGKGHRVLHHQTPMVTRDDCCLEYSGQQLDESDATLMMALIYFAQAYPLGAMVPLNRAAILRKMGKTAGKTDYAWLHERLKALRAAVLFLEARKPDKSIKYKIGGIVSFNLIKELAGFEEPGEEYTYALDPRWVKLFSNREFGVTDFEKRLQIGRGQDMAKSLQRLITASKDPVQRFSLAFLKGKMRYASPMRKFKDSLLSAVSELKRHGLVDRGEIGMSTRGSEQLTIWVKAAIDAPMDGE
jgi:hypothetical protein